MPLRAENPFRALIESAGGERWDERQARFTVTLVALR